MRSLLGLLLVLAGPAGTAVAADYWVKNGGNDAAPGLSPATAWATLGHAAAVVNPGDTVHVLDGSYQGFDLRRSGTETSPSPGGAGLTASPALTRWTYTDRTGAHGGITRVRVRDRSRVADGLLAVVLKGGGGAAIALPDTGATRAAVVLGTAGECAAIAWNPPGGRPPALRRRRGDAHMPLTGRRSPG